MKMHDHFSIAQKFISLLMKDDERDEQFIGNLEVFEFDLDSEILLFKCLIDNEILSFFL